jgi:hypothetical protein
VEIPLRIPLREQDVSDTSAKLVQEVRDRIRSQKQAEGALIAGRAYCFRCDSVMCEHGRPAKARDVFDGYTSMGRPRFTDFVTLAIDRRDPGLERLLAGDTRILAFVDRGDALKTEQLSEFGKTSHVYDLVGQVTAGLFDVGGEHRRAAVSFQAVLVRNADGAPRLKAHYVSAVDIFDKAHPSLGRIFSSFQKALDQESIRLFGDEKSQSGESDKGAAYRVLPILRELARDLTHEAKGRERRTLHAIDRTEDRGRPTETAYPDARRAPDASILTDTQEGTIVVLGPKNRAHIFSPDARHVTSVIVRGGNIQKRVRMGRWRPAEPDERGTFRESLKTKGVEDQQPEPRERPEQPARKPKQRREPPPGMVWTAPEVETPDSPPRVLETPEVTAPKLQTPEQAEAEPPPVSGLGSAPGEEPAFQAPPEGS